jgi:hypothetical protein
VIAFDELLTALSKFGVKFIIAGGAAAIAHGSATLVERLDMVFERSPANLDRLVAALSLYKPYLRGAPAGLPFIFDAATLRRGLNFALTTSAGYVDLLGYLIGGGSYEELLPNATQIEAFGFRCDCLTVQQLIWATRAAGNPKDLQTLAELEVIEEETADGQS